MDSTEFLFTDTLSERLEVSPKDRALDRTKHFKHLRMHANACGRKGEAVETRNLREARSSLYLQRGFISSDHFSVQTFH